MDSIISVLLDNLPWFWVAVTIICVVIESLTLALTTIWFGISAFLMVFLCHYSNLPDYPLVIRSDFFLAQLLLYNWSCKNQKHQSHSYKYE